MYKFISKLGTMAENNDTKNCFVNQNALGVANRKRETKDTALPMSVCGRVKSHKTFKKCTGDTFCTSGEVDC